MPDQTRSNIKLGDYVLEKLEIYSLFSDRTENLKNFFRYIELHEDLYSSSITAKLHIEDAVNFPEILPIIGQERVFISFKTNADGFDLVDLSFRVYKLDNQRINENGKSQEYVLHLISEGGFLNYSQRCGYHVRGRCSSMVVSVFENHFPKSLWENRLYIEPSDDKYSLVVPASFTPFKAINWLASKAYSESGDGYTPYFFYENLDGYNFRSLKDIVTYPNPSPRVKYFHTVANIPTSTITENQYNHGFYKIQSMEELNRFDASSNLINGVVSSYLSVHDLVRKEQRVSTFKESDVFEQKVKTGNEPLYRSKNKEELTAFSAGSLYTHLPNTISTVFDEVDGIVDNFKLRSIYLKRKYHLNSMFTQQLTVQVFGDSDRRVGDVVQIDVPKPQGDAHQLESQLDKNLSGDYIITAIKHTLSTVYSCRYELSRNCMGV